MLISIDPGAKLAGVACWDDGELANAFLVRGKDWLDTAGNVGAQVYLRFPVPHRDGAIAVVIEQPQVYHQSKQPGDPNDLITLALMAGATVARVAQGSAVLYKPAEWKKQVPKEIMVERIKRRLTAEEHARVDLPRTTKLQHNVWDAVGLGLHHLRRFRG